MTINIEHLYKQIGRTSILKDVNLAVEEGEVIGLLGPNGAGKSTLMKILVGQWAPTTGEVHVCGVDMTKDPHLVAPMIGYLPENNPLYDDMYIREYLNFMCKIGKGIKLSRVEEVIDMVGLGPEVEKKIGMLSKGYRQRVGLAQALLQDPKLLVLDEPTTGLDPNQLEDIRSLIRELGKDRTVILSTHILQEVPAMCNRVLIINHGVLCADLKDLNGVNLEQLFREVTANK